MGYRLHTKNSFKKCIKKLKGEIINDIDEIVDNKLLIDPYKYGDPYRNKLKPAFKYSFNRKPEYRIIYYVEKCNITANNKKKCKYNICKTEQELTECKGQVVLVLLLTREACDNLYNSSRTEIKNYLSYL